MIPTNFDIYNPWAWRFDAVMQPESRAAFRRLIEQGWTDDVRSLHPNERMYSFWVNAAAFQRGAGFRLDFLLVNRIAARALVAAASTRRIADARSRATTRRSGSSWSGLRLRVGTRSPSPRAAFASK